MTGDSADHEARRIASLALARIEQHEKHCEERARKAEIFEAEMRVGIKDMASSFRDGLSRIHGRLDALTRGALFGLGGIVVSAVGTALWWLITAKGAG
jgi:hypothetical protein